MQNVAVSKDKSLGASLRMRRKELQLTMQQVADGAGLSTGFISQVERDLTAPSLSSLVSISKVLRVPVGQYLDQPVDGGTYSMQAGRKLYGVAPGERIYERLSTSFPGSLLRSVIIHEPPGHRGEPISHDGEEMIYVVSGEITVELEGQTRVMTTGDSIHFSSRRTHSTWNQSDTETIILWCGTMDIFGDSEPDPIHRKQ